MLQPQSRNAGPAGWVQLAQTGLRARGRRDTQMNQRRPQPRMTQADALLARRASTREDGNRAQLQPLAPLLELHPHILSSAAPPESQRRRERRWGLFTFSISPSLDDYLTCKYSCVTSCQPQFPVCQPECVCPRSAWVCLCILFRFRSLETPCLCS